MPASNPTSAFIKIFQSNLDKKYHTAFYLICNYKYNQQNKAIKNIFI